MLKKIFFFLLLFRFGFIFSQTKITYTKDSDAVYTAETIKTAVFENFENPINNGLENGVYWFKITGFSSEETTIQIPNDRIKIATAYQDNIAVPRSENERFVTFETKNKATVYLKLNVTREALIPITVASSKDFLRSEKNNILFLGFYIGFTFVIGLINLFYYINFKDFVFLYYIFFIYAQCIGLFVSDGILHLFNYEESTITIVEVLDHSFGVIFSILFTTTYLQTKKYYPLFKRNMFILNAFAILFGLLFVFTDNHIWYVIMDVLVFGIFICLWIVGAMLFSKNLFTKIFVIAYFFVLLFGISFFINKLFGIPLIINSTQLKFGAFLEMIILSYAVVYRMKILQNDNTKMREEIISYAKEIENLSGELQKNATVKSGNLTHADLTIREEEILQLIIKGIVNKEIAEKLNISINTVKYHVKNIYDKLQIKSRREAKNLTLSR